MKYPFLGKYGQQSGDYLGLTMAGAVKLSPYSEGCHKDSLAGYISAEKKTAVKEPIRFYTYVCNNYCKKHRIDPNYPALARLSARLGIERDALIYLPVEERVKEKKLSTKPPYREAAHVYKKSKREFQYRPQEKLDDIGEAIKQAAFIASGIQAPVLLPLSDNCFEKRAAILVGELVLEHKRYALDLATIVQQVDDYIDYACKNFSTMPHIKDISSAENAKLEAHKAIAKFTPIVLKPFSEKRLNI